MIICAFSDATSHFGFLLQWEVLTIILKHLGPAEVATWLGDTGSVSPALFKRRSGSVLMVGENKISLTQGVAFARAINATTGRNRRLDSIATTGSGRTQRITNWEILTPILRRLGCTLDPDARKSIVSGATNRPYLVLHGFVSYPSRSPNCC